MEILQDLLRFVSGYLEALSRFFRAPAGFFRDGKSIDVITQLRILVDCFRILEDPF